MRLWRKSIENPQLVGLICAFVVSGIATPMIIMKVKFEHTPRPETLWPLYPLYLGNLLVGSFSAPLPRRSWNKGSKLFGCDIGGQICSNLGLLAIGPPLYSIFYKSVTVFTALLSLVVLPTASHPTALQWIAILVISAGLCIQGTSALNDFRSRQIGGISLVLLGCLSYGAGAVYSELYLGVEGDSLGPLQAAWVFGVAGCSACAVWSAFTIQGVITSPSFWLAMAMMVATNAIHQATWFFLVGRIGACATAVLKAFQSACLFFAGSFAFCRSDRNECLTAEKVICFIVVTAGVLVFSYRSSAPAPSPEETSPLLPYEQPDGQAARLAHDFKRGNVNLM